MITSLLFLALNIFAQDTCQPPVRYIPLPLNNENKTSYGQYMRVHPSGKYIMISGCNTKTEIGTTASGGMYTTFESYGVCLVDLTNANETTPGKLIQTQMIDEAYPLEPDWKMIASPNHENGTQMQYYSFESLLKTPLAQQKPFAKDSFNEFYHSLARTSSNGMRMMTWSSMQFKDFKISGSGDQTNLQGSDVKLACQNLMGSNFNYSEYKTIRDKLIKMNQEYSVCSEKVARKIVAAGKTPRDEDFDVCNTADGYDELKARFDELQKPVDQVLENPILSKDGRELGALNDGKITIMGIDEKGSCSIKENLNFRGSKVNFSHPVPGKKGRIAFTNITGDEDEMMMPKRTVYVYDRDRKKLLPVGDNPIGSSYPGFTKDGNLMYLTRGTDGAIKIAIVELKSFNFESCMGEAVPAATAQ